MILFIHDRTETKSRYDQVLLQHKYSLSQIWPVLGGWRVINRIRKGSAISMHSRKKSNGGSVFICCKKLEIMKGSHLLSCQV